MDKIILMNQARLQKRQDRDISTKKTAGEIFEKYKNDSLFLSGITLYWAEGTRLNKDSRKYQLAFTNSDSDLISFYRRFLKNYFSNIKEEDWRVGLFLYPDINPKQAIDYWANVISISQSQFIKSQILNSNIKCSRRLRYGTCCLYVNSKDACLTMEYWIKSVSDSMRR